MFAHQVCVFSVMYHSRGEFSVSMGLYVWVCVIVVGMHLLTNRFVYLVLCINEWGGSVRCQCVGCVFWGLCGSGWEGVKSRRQPDLTMSLPLFLKGIGL